MKTYKGDPQQITCKFGKCAKCGQNMAGKAGFYWPNGRKVYCVPCGDKDYRQFLAAAFEEEGTCFAC